MNKIDRTIKFEINFPEAKHKCRILEMFVTDNSILTAYEKAEDIINEICVDIFQTVGLTPMANRTIAQLFLLKNELNDAIVRSCYNRDKLVKYFFQTISNAMNSEIWECSDNEETGSGFMFALSVNTKISSFQDDVDDKRDDE